jgi:hypothetical protein
MITKLFVQTGKLIGRKVMIPDSYEIVIDESGSHSVVIRDGVRMTTDEESASKPSLQIVPRYFKE